MTREEADFIGAMNMCDEISNEAYKKIMCHCEEQEPCADAKDIIEGLKFTKAMYEFDPDTGDKVEPHMMNDLNRTTYDAVCGALERLTPKRVGGDTVRLVDLHNGVWKKVGGYKCPECNVDVRYRIRFCQYCGQALDWRTK